MSIENTPSPNYTKEEEQQFQQSSEMWVNSLIERHDPAKILSLLPYDPDKYPYQKMDTALVKSFRPSWAEIVELGEMAARNRVLVESQKLCTSLVGAENYDKFVNDIANQETDGRRENVIRTIWGRMNAPGQNVTILTLHSKIMSLPLLQAARANAMAGSAYVRSPHFKEVYGTFNLFDYTAQNFTFVNAALARMAINLPSGETVPVLDVVSKFSNVVPLVPPTTSSTKVGIEKSTRTKVNAQAMAAFGAAVQELKSHGKSAVLTIDPTASTADHIYKDGRLVALHHKRANQLTSKMLQDSFPFIVPELFWWDKNPRQPSWYIGEPTSIWHTTEDTSVTAAEKYNAVVAELGAAEVELSGADVYFGSSPLGRLALAETAKQV